MLNRDYEEVENLDIYEIYTTVLTHHANEPWHPLLLDLDNEIGRLKEIAIDDPEKKQRRNTFAKNLRVLYNELKDNIEHQADNRSAWDNKEKRSKEILNCPAGKLTYDIMVTLSKLSYNAAQQEQDTSILLAYESKYKKKCEKTPILFNFAKAVSAIVVTGLGFVIGATVRSLLGAAVGLLIPSPVTSVMGTVLGGIIGGIGGAAGGYYIASTRLGIHYGEFKHFLIGKSPFHSAAKQVGKTGHRFFSEKKIQKNRECQSISHEVLALSRSLR